MDAINRIMKTRKNLISKRTGMGDHMIADDVTDKVFPNVEKYIDIISSEGKLGDCIKNQYVTVDWIKTLIATKEWKYITKEKSLYQYFIDCDRIIKPNSQNIEEGEDETILYQYASGDMQFDFDDLTNEQIEAIKEAYIIVAKKSAYYRWFEYSWSYHGCHVRIYAPLYMKTKEEWGFYYIHLLNQLLKHIDEKHREVIMLHIDWSCCSITRGFAIPYNDGGVIYNEWHSEDELHTIQAEAELDKAFQHVQSQWYDELFNYYYKRFIKPKKRKELEAMGLVNDDHQWKYRYSMEEEWNFNENHPMVSGEDYNYNWRLSLVTTLMGIFNNEEIVRNICSVIYQYITPYKNHTYEEMIGNEFENKIIKRANFELEPSHIILKELWNDWNLKITIRPRIL